MRTESEDIPFGVPLGKDVQFGKYSKSRFFRLGLKNHTESKTTTSPFVVAMTRCHRMPTNPIQFPFTGL